MKWLIGIDAQHSFPLTGFLLNPHQSALAEPACAPSSLIWGEEPPSSTTSLGSPISHPLLCSCSQLCGEAAGQRHLVSGSKRTFWAIPAPLQCTQIFLLQRNTSSFWPQTDPVSEDHHSSWFCFTHAMGEERHTTYFINSFCLKCEYWILKQPFITKEALETRFPAQSTISVHSVITS